MSGCTLEYDQTPLNPIWIYVDDSNIWIEAKKFASRERRFKTREDHRVRIEIGRLTDLVADKRPVAQGFLYGSEPPPVDTVWEKIKQKGWKVDPYRRSRMTGKEKKIDTQLVADVTEKVITTPEKERSTIVLITGDADAIPAIEKALKYDGWSVEVYMWKHAIASDLRKLASKCERKLSLHYLDDFLKDVTFTNLKFRLEGNEHLKPFIRQSGVVFKIEKGQFKNGVPPYWWSRKVDSIAQWPFQYYWVEEKDDFQSNHLVLTFKHDGKNVFDSTDFMEAVKNCELEYVESVLPYLEFEQQYKGIYELATYGRFKYEDALKTPEDDLESNYTSDEERSPSYKLVRYSHRRSKQQYSEPCEYKYNCKFGASCHYFHTEKEMAFFRSNMGKGKAYRKVRQCNQFPNCKKSKEECQYAHGEEDSWCLICLGSKGHFTNSCPEKPN